MRQPMGACGFRPITLRIGDSGRPARCMLPMAAFTATADAETRAEILKRLFEGRAPKHLFARGLHRPNITLNFYGQRGQPRANRS